MTSEKKVHRGDLNIDDSNAAAMADMTEVTGDLVILCEIDLPALTSVGGWLGIRADAQLPALTSVGGWLDIRADAQLPALEEVGKSLRVECSGKLHAPLWLGPIFREIESDGQYALCRSDEGHYVAGCRGPWSAEDALSHWRDNPRPNNQDRSALYVAAIEKAEAQHEDRKNCGAADLVRAFEGGEA